ncbi:MAG: GlsB/YeaQ/YmgE family stress response membrane protein [Dokdonella sp.]|nr:GlsB/YeaQ/YmgE family stress response membrane protein [Dokdonella sp.]MCB1571954.1 GlsB/YeaQ/YmgE family stress response membrane protein [Xanthomonadales bacterium]MCB1572538.1 GlsB/YeaQ/YmgE family stress response membrane protein [Xanthomonadales bacterium]MCB1576092.1 GlsB/YeaQ/YmgE family stress response membrane protein [Xanthomonadales bacterium]
MHGSHSATTSWGSVLTIESLLIFLLVGAIAGWLAGLVVKGRGLGLIGNIVIGILGAFIAGWLLPQLGIYIGGGLIGAILNAMIGAIILLVIVMALRRA